MRRLYTLAVALLAGLLPLKAQELVVFPSENLHCNDSVLVFSPASQIMARELPTLFLLHGYSGCYADWSRHMDLQAVCDATGFRIICPDGFYKSWYLNDAKAENMQWRTFFWEECWPTLDARYGFSPEKTFIDGLSMGGHGAMNLFLDHPERFRGAGSMSGILALHHSGGSKQIIPAILGVEDIEDPVVAAQSAVNRLGRVREICADAPKLIVVSCGLQDKFLPATEEFAAALKASGLSYVELYSPEAHTWTYWTWVLPLHLKFFGEAM